jgi:hypothetical protein
LKLQNLADLIRPIYQVTRMASREAAPSHIPKFIFEIHFDVSRRWAVAPLRAGLGAPLVIGYTQLQITNWAHSETNPDF